LAKYVLKMVYFLLNLGLMIPKLRLKEDLYTCQVTPGEYTQGFLYQKGWKGTVVIEVEPTESEGKQAAFLRAYLGGVYLPFSPSKFVLGPTRTPNA
jgi:hypothetical protein